MNRLACSGIFDAAAWCYPADGTRAGFIIVQQQTPPPDRLGRMPPVIRLGTYGSRLGAVPSSAIHTLLWHACRHEPIIPTLPQ